MLNRWSQEKVSTRLAASLLQSWRVHEGGVWLSTLCRDCYAASVAAGPFSLFKGMASPLVTASFVNAIVFASYNETMKVTLPSRCITPWKAAWADEVQPVVLADADRARREAQAHLQRGVLGWGHGRRRAEQHQLPVRGRQVPLTGEQG